MNEKDREYLQKTFPKMMEEMEEGNKLQIDAVRTDFKEAEKAVKKDRKNSRTAIDFIRLCEDEEEALEIIDYLEEQDRISPKYAKSLRTQLAAQGLRSFGAKRKPGSLE